MSRRGAVCTIIAKNYLPQARCLLDSVAQFHPELDRFVILVDRADGCFNSATERFTVIRSEDLSIPESKWFHFKYSLLEVCTAVKPYAIEHLFSQYDFDFVVYLDPDILVYAPLDSLLDRLEYHSLLVTPHVTGPLDPKLGPSELDILRTGTYNLGFLGVARTPESLAFLEWWKQRLHEHCVIDLPRGLFLDQRWVDFAPSFISRFCVVRETGYNVAYWNISQREISVSQGRFLIDGGPLYFFHFSGFDPDAPNCLSRYRPGDPLPPEGALTELAQQYKQLLFDYGYSESRDWPYAYGYFQNGIRIPDLGRSIDREDSGIADRIKDPFCDAGFDEFVRIWNQPVPGAPGDRPTITRLAYKVYRTCSDLQAGMPDIFNGDYSRFRKWLLSKGAEEHVLPDVFLAPFKNLVPFRNDETHELPVGRPAPCDILPSGDSWRLTERRARYGAESSLASPLAHQIPAGRAGLYLPRLALEIYNKRPDLQAFFPDPVGKDGVKYLVWLLSYGSREYEISKVFLATLERQWAAIVDSLPTLREKLRYRMLLSLATLGAALGPLLGQAVRARLMLPSFEAIQRLVSNLPAAQPAEETPRAVADSRLKQMPVDTEAPTGKRVYYGVKTAGD